MRVMVVADEEDKRIYDYFKKEIKIGGLSEDEKEILDEAVKAVSLAQKHIEYIKKGLKESLRDNMTDLELVLTMLSEASTKEISKTVKPQGLEENVTVAKMGGSVAKNARKEIESKTGKSVISTNLIK